MGRGPSGIWRLVTNPSLGVVAVAVLVTVGLIVVDRLRERRAARLDPINLARARRRWPWGGLILGLVAVGLLVLLSGQPTQPGPRPGPGPSPGPEVVAQGTTSFRLLLMTPAIILSLMAGLIALRLIRQRRNPYFRALLQAYQGQHDDAIATARAAMARHEAALATSAAPATPPGDDPWAAPTTGGANPHRRALADGWHALSVVEADRKNWPTALQHAEQALRIDSAHAPIYTASRASALIELGHAAEALPLLRATLATPLARNPWARSVFLLGLAKGLIATGQTREASAVLNEAQRLGRRVLVSPRLVKQKWRTRIVELRSQIAAAGGDAGPPSVAAQPSEPGPSSNPSPAG